MRVTGSHPDRRPEAAGQGTAGPWHSPGRQGGSPVELAWLALAAICVIALVVFPHWRVAVLAAIVIALAWRANRMVTARDLARAAADADRILLAQHQFLQDASHQLRTPITIALGHAELLATELAGRQRRDIHVVVGELERLKALSERLLLVAVAQNPDFLSPSPAALNVLAAELLRRWQPVAARRWQLGRLDPVTAMIDPDRLSLALDALIENAVRHTGPQDEISVSVIGPDDDRNARIVVRDGGAGIAAADVAHIFDRFASFGCPASRGNGLGLALVQAVARGHGGDVTVSSTLGEGSRFELVLPARAVDDSAITDGTIRDRGYRVPQDTP